MTKKSTEHWNENFYGKDLRGKDFSGHFFYRCCFQAAIMDETTKMRAVAMQNCNLTLIEGAGSIWDKAIIDHSDACYSDFTNAKFPFARIRWTSCRGTKFSGADLTGVETDNSKFQNTKFDGAKLTGWSREIIAEILNQQTANLQLKLIASWIERENQLCWDQFMIYKDHPGIRDSVEELFTILRRFGYGELIDNGGRLCHQADLQPQRSQLESVPQPLSGRR